jgi:hypothetical protein
MSTGSDTFGPRPVDWREDWSWPRLIQILSNNDWVEARRSVTRNFLAFQASCFDKLLDVLNDPSLSPAPWQRPFIRLIIEFPFEWDTEIPLRDVKLSTPGRDLFLTLLILTAGVAVSPGESFKLLPPKHLARYLRRFSPDEARTHLDDWLATGLDYVSYGDKLSNPLEECTLNGTGRKGAYFRASLALSISPRIIDHRERRSGFAVLVGLPWQGSDSLLPPQRWSDEERAALRQTVQRFFRALQESIHQPEAMPAEIRELVPHGARSSGLTSFAALTRDSKGVHFLKKVSVRSIAQSIWSRFPAYTLGLEGPTLPISDGHGELLLLAASTIGSLMLHPDDEASREEFIAQEHLHHLDGVICSLEEDGWTPEEIRMEWAQILSLVATEGVLTPKVVRALRTAPSMVEITRRMNDRIRRGMLVGEILLTIITCQHHHPEHASLRKAIYLIQQGVKAGGITADSLPGRTYSLISKEWKRFKAVAHLWAAARSVSEEPDFTKSMRVILDRKFLARAEALRLLGEECFGRGQKRSHGPLLNPASTWRTPRDLELPSVSLVIEPLPEWSFGQLAKYRARS